MTFAYGDKCCVECKAQAGPSACWDASCRCHEDQGQPGLLVPVPCSEDGEREKEALRRIWKAMGCEQNLDDFKPTVRDRMWDQVVDIAQKDAAKNNRLYRENAELVAGVRSRDARIAEGENYFVIQQTRIEYLQGVIAAKDAVIARAYTMAMMESGKSVARFLHEHADGASNG